MHAFPKRVNVGFMQVLSRREIKLRVYERGTAKPSPAARACAGGGDRPVQRLAG